MNLKQVTLRSCRTDDRDTLQALTIEAFDGVTLEQNVEDALGILAGHDWTWRKARHVDEDMKACPQGLFVAEYDGEIVGYISTRVDTDAGKGRIPNLVVAAEHRGHGLGRVLIEHALEWFRQERLEYAVIETMAQNEIGNHLYRSCGFQEVARQIHFARRLGPADAPET
jgi:ribosomal protein S18 acetylase RimI-like enzyme